MNELRRFKKLADHTQASVLVKLLRDNNIKCKLVEVASSWDASFGGGELTRVFEVKILQSDFNRANNILENQAEASISHVDKDHYLFEFTNEELFDILLKPDEWNEFDYKLATKILNDRGENVSEELINSIKNQRIKGLEKPEVSQKTWIYAGYLFSLLGGILGVFIGWHIWRATKVLPDGRKVFS